MLLSRILAAALVCGTTFIASESMAQQQPAAVTRKATLRFAWWNPPANPPELALLQDKDRIPVWPESMSFSIKSPYFGPPVAILAKKTLGTEKDKQGNPVVIWVPFVSVPIPTDGSDLAVILFADPSGQSARTQVFDFSEQAFPYGSIQIVNYTNARIDAAIGSASFQIPSGGLGRYPGRFTKRQPARFFLAVTEPGSDPRLITSTTMIFFPNTRMMYFMLETPGAKPEDRYHNSLIMENKVIEPAIAPPPSLIPPSEIKGKGKAKAAEGGAS
jgi:hypothetical protein